MAFEEKIEKYSTPGKHNEDSGTESELSVSDR